MAITFDTLGYAQRLRDNGIDQKHAEAHAEAARDFIMPELVTKADLKAALDQQTLRIGVMIGAAIGVTGGAIAILSKLM